MKQEGGQIRLRSGRTTYFATESPFAYSGRWKRPVPPSHNWKEQLGMATTTDPAAVVLDQENLIQGVAKHFLQKVFGPQGMPWGTKFSDLEELTVQIGQAISRTMMD